MDSIEINSELKKINNIHHSLDETNVMTYLIFLENFRSKLSAAQIQWIDDKIDRLTDKTRVEYENSLVNIDVELAKQPLVEKTEEYGILSNFV